MEYTFGPLLSILFLYSTRTERESRMYWSTIEWWRKKGLQKAPKTWKETEDAHWERSVRGAVPQQARFSFHWEKLPQTHLQPNFTTT